MGRSSGDPGHLMDSRNRAGAWAVIALRGVRTTNADPLGALAVLPRGGGHPRQRSLNSTSRRDSKLRRDPDAPAPARNQLSRAPGRQSIAWSPTFLYTGTVSDRRWAHRFRRVRFLGLVRISSRPRLAHPLGSTATPTLLVLVQILYLFDSDAQWPTLGPTEGNAPGRRWQHVPPGTRRQRHACLAHRNGSPITCWSLPRSDLVVPPEPTGRRGWRSWRGKPGRTRQKAHRTGGPRSRHGHSRRSRQSQQPSCTLLEGNRLGSRCASSPHSASPDTRWRSGMHLYTMALRPVVARRRTRAVRRRSDKQDRRHPHRRPRARPRTQIDDIADPAGTSEASRTGPRVAVSPLRASRWSPSSPPQA